MTCILGVQIKGKPHLFADSRITTGDLYHDGNNKLFKVNHKVLVGVAGNAYMLDLLQELLPKLKRKATALTAARTLEQLFMETPRAKDSGEFSFLFVSRNEAALFEEDGVLRVHFNDNCEVSAGSGGVIAQAVWAASEYQRTSNPRAAAEYAVMSAHFYRVDCGGEVSRISC